MTRVISFVFTWSIMFCTPPPSPFVAGILVTTLVIWLHATHRGEIRDARLFRLWMEERFPRATITAVQCVRLLALKATQVGACPVCRQATARPRTCPACATPHHTDCWHYNGWCAVYGCGGRAGVQPVARSKEAEGKEEVGSVLG